MRALKRFRAFLFMAVCLTICSVQAVQVICAVNIRGGGSTTATYDVFLSNDDILSVYQPVNSDDSTWTKYGHNATLNANATKIETTNVEALQSALTNKDSEGNADLTKIDANLTYGTDDYTKSTTPPPLENCTHPRKNEKCVQFFFLHECFVAIVLFEKTKDSNKVNL